MLAIVLQCVGEFYLAISYCYYFLCHIYKLNFVLSMRTQKNIASVGLSVSLDIY